MLMYSGCSSTWSEESNSLLSSLLEFLLLCEDDDCDFDRFRACLLTSPVVSSLVTQVQEGLVGGGENVHVKMGEIVHMYMNCGCAHERRVVQSAVKAKIIVQKNSHRVNAPGKKAKRQ